MKQIDSPRPVAAAEIKGLIMFNVTIDSVENKKADKPMTCHNSDENIPRTSRVWSRLGMLVLASVLPLQSALAAGPAPLDLLSTANFTILAGAAITTTGGGVISGDVGASPITGAAVAVSDAQVNGTIYTVDNAGPSGSVMDPVRLTAAKNDLTTAYNDAANRTPVPTGPELNPNGGNLGGLNLAPGLYKFTGTCLITGSDLTLTGGPDDVWIFQIAADLQLGSMINVILAGGAKARNIFWQVGTSATLGTFSSFKGTILADQSITMMTSATMDGRALAFGGGVTFDGTSGDLPTSELSIDDVGVLEGNTGTTQLMFTVTLSATSTLDVAFTATTSASTGTADFVTDYVATNASLTIPAGQLTTNFFVTVNGDILSESNEWLFVDLILISNATVSDAQGQGTITNDDSVGLSISDPSVVEGNAGTTQLVFTVTLPATNVSDVSFTATTSNGTAEAGTDYVATNAILTIPAGQLTTNFYVTVNGDVVVESNEWFFVDLTSISNAAASDAQGQGTITNDDSVGLSISDPSVVEGNAGTTQAVFTVTLSATNGLDVSFTATTSNGTAEAGTDYVATNAILIIPAGQLTTNFYVTVNGDVLAESNEWFFVDLTSLSNAIASDAQGQGMITDDDSVGLSISDASVVEGNAGTTQAMFTVTLSATNVLDVSFTAMTSNGTAEAGTDYGATNAILTIPAGQLTTNFYVTVNGDVVVESNEWFFVDLTSISNAIASDAQGQGAITNDDNVVSGSVITVSGPLFFTGVVYSVIQDQTVTVSNVGGSTESYVISSDSFWLDVSNANATLPAGGSTTHVVHVSTVGLDAGTYGGVLTVTVAGSTNSSPVIPVTLTLTPVVGQTHVVAWGNNKYGQTNVPSGLTNVIAVSAGDSFSMALRADGTLLGWGRNNYGQLNIPAGLTNVMAVAAGDGHVVALRGDGTVAVWGDGRQKQLQMPTGLTTVVAISAGETHSMVLLSNGTVVAWGKNDKGQTNAPTGLQNVIGISAGRKYSMAILRDGTIVAWGKNDNGQTNSARFGLVDIVAIDAGGRHSTVLRGDGTVFAWGNNAYGQCNVPSGLVDVVAIDVGDVHSLAKQSSGQVVGWGRNKYGEINIPSDVTNAVSVDAGRSHSMAIVYGETNVPLLKMAISTNLVSSSDGWSDRIVDGPGDVQVMAEGGLSPVNLGTTIRFMILAGAEITSTGGAMILGDVGASPISGSAIGLNAVQVNGTIYAVDASGPSGSVMDPTRLTTAKGDLTIAYNDARDRTPVPTGPFLNPNGGNLGGQVLVPGLYKFTSTCLITGSDVTLVGDANDVWIFQIADDLQVGNGINVTLAGGAQARNIFWQVGTSATIGTSASFKGTILAAQSITMNSTATLDGRMLAFSAGVVINGTAGSLPDLEAPAFTEITQSESNRVTLVLNTTPHFQLTLQSGPSMSGTNWTTLVTQTPVLSTCEFMNVAASNAACFYRAFITLN